jgi:hypothetical protein
MFVHSSTIRSLPYEPFMLLYLFWSESHSHKARWDSSHDAIWLDVMRHHAASGDNRTGTDNEWGKEDGTVTNPHIVLYFDPMLVPVAGVPNCLANFVHQVLIRAEESTSGRDEDVVANVDIAHKKGMQAHSYVIAQGNILMRRPEPVRPVAMHVSPVS